MGDIQDADFGTPDGHLSLRAERDGAGGGRIYTLTYSVTDGSGKPSWSSLMMRME